MKAEAEKITKELADTSWNTYVRHGIPGGSVESRTYDVWGGGGRGDPIASGTGFDVADKVLASGGPEPLYIIRQGDMWRAGAWNPWPEDPHYDHTHVSYTADGKAGASGGSVSIPNPLQALFENRWNAWVKPGVEDAKRKMASGFILRRAAGNALGMAADGVHDFIDEKIPDTILGSSGS